MSITDELRKWAEDNTLQDRVLTTYPPQHAVHGVLETILRIADRIDAEHRRQCAESWMRGHDAWNAIDRSDEMAEHGWIRLPKDADGEVIHIGDVMEYPNGGREEVRFMTLNGAGWLVNEAGWLPVQLHHHHAPTVEDVLREMADRIYADEGEPRDRDAIVAEFAAKLELREVGE